MTSSGRRALLGRLAGLGWFSRQGEVAATQALAMLLDEPLLREAVLGLLTRRTEVDLDSVTRFQAEAVHEDGGRPDLEGVTDDDLPLVMVEAKFGAILTAGQLDSYFGDQARRLETTGANRPRGVIVVLVPPHRVSAAELAYEDLMQKRAVAGLPPYPSAVAILDWGDWLGCWEEAVAQLPATPDSIAGDLVQLRELCLTLGGLHIRPLGDLVPGPSWRARAADLATLVDQVTQKLRDPASRIPPIQHESGYDPLRYIPGGYRLGGSSCSVGLASRFADEGASPLWLRYHRATPHFAAISDLLLASGLRHSVRTDDRHLWLPLNIDPDLPGEMLADHLVDQVKSIQALLASPDRAAKP
jgi:hypothetical protein